MTLQSISVGPSETDRLSAWLDEVDPDGGPGRRATLQRLLEAVLTRLLPLKGDVTVAARSGPAGVRVEVHLPWEVHADEDQALVALLSRVAADWGAYRLLSRSGDTRVVWFEVAAATVPGPRAPAEQPQAPTTEPSARG